jgi:precorrin-2 dehydrogenase/sirohydrochlorin ferrochelatase
MPEGGVWSMKYYPIGLQIEGRSCLVVGGGRVAERKARGLIECGAKVTVISPELTPGLTTLLGEGVLHWEARGYRGGDSTGFFLVMAATDDPEVQDQVQADALRGQTLLNVADVPEKCNFILPALVRRGGLTVAISTSGKSPALAKKLRQEIEGWLVPQYEIVVEALGVIRPYVLAWGLPQAENEKIFQGMLDRGIVEEITHNHGEGLVPFLEQTLGQGLPAELTRQLKKLLCR